MKKVIIIGATSGIGKALAEIYLHQGWTIGITGRSKNILEAIQEKYPGKVFIECFDVRDSENKMHFDNLLRKLDGMDLFIYNSGYGDVSKELDWEIERATFEINAKGFIELMNYAFSYFIKKGEGQIAAISSIAATRGNSFAPAYSATKAFVSNYCEGLSLKANRMKIPVYITDIQPGFVKTRMAKADGQFWIAPVEKATQQMVKAIKKKKRKVYITRRWALIAWAMKWMPWFIYKRIG